MSPQFLSYLFSSCTCKLGLNVSFFPSPKQHSWHYINIVCNQFQNGLEYFCSSAFTEYLSVHKGFFDKVLCIKVTIMFGTDVLYIFDILMFILFCEENLGNYKTWPCVSVGTAQGLIFCFVSCFPLMAKSMLGIL